MQMSLTYAHDLQQFQEYLILGGKVSKNLTLASTSPSQTYFILQTTKQKLLHTVHTYSLHKHIFS
jgi:hypothetical protein